MKPVYEVKYGRLGYFIASFFTLFLVMIFTWVGFFFDGPINRDAFIPKTEVPIGVTIGCSIGILVGTFLLIHWIGRFIKNPSVFTIYKEGFESNTNGVSTGLINWKDVAMLKEDVVDVSTGRGTRQELAFAIYLKDFDKYVNKQPVIIRYLLKLSELISGQQTYTKRADKGLPIMVPADLFGKNYEEFKEKISETSGLSIS